MTQPKHARDIKGKGRYYGACSPTCPLGDQMFISVTNAQSVVNKAALPPAAAKVTAETAWELLPRMVATSRQSPAGPNGCDKARVADRCGECRFCVTAQIKAEYKQQWETKADLGTLIHAHAHGVHIGQPMPYDERVDPFIDQHLAFLEAWRIDLDKHVEAAETTVFDPRHGYAGTGDLWLHLPLAWNPAKATAEFTSWTRRKLWLIDGKSSLTKPAKTVYNDQPLQLAALRFAPKAVLVDDSEVDVPRFEGAAILNWRTDSHALVPLPSDREVHKAFLAAVTLQTHFHDQDTKAWLPLDAPALPEPKTRKVA